jgi:hypothetical protein
MAAGQTTYVGANLGQMTTLTCKGLRNDSMFFGAKIG